MRLKIAGRLIGSSVHVVLGKRAKTTEATEAYIESKLCLEPRNDTEKFVIQID
jgi:hypothetical protein